MIPVVVRTTGKHAQLVPNSLREAAYALGTPKWKLVMMVTLRAAQAGVLTGALLAFARISGETAPLLFTALNNQFFSTNMNQPIANLPNVIYQFAMSPYSDLARAGLGCRAADHAHRARLPIFWRATSAAETADRGRLTPTEHLLTLI